MQQNEIKNIFKQASSIDLIKISQAIMSGEMSSELESSSLGKVIKIIQGLSSDERVELQNAVFEDNGIDEETINSIKNGASNGSNEEKAVKTIDIVVSSVDATKKIVGIKKIKDLTNSSLVEAKKIFEHIAGMQEALAACKNANEKNKLLTENKASILIQATATKDDLTKKNTESAEAGIVLAGI